MRDVVHACWQPQYMGNVYKCSIPVITETQLAIQTQVTQHPNCTERLHVDATIIKSYRKGYFHVSYRRRVFKMSLLSNYRVKCYDYVVKWGSDISCNLCASLVIGLLSVLRAAWYIAVTWTNVVSSFTEVDCQGAQIKSGGTVCASECLAFVSHIFGLGINPTSLHKSSRFHSFVVPQFKTFDSWCYKHLCVIPLNIRV